MTKRLPVFQGTFSDIRSVKTRGVVQLIIELPIEKAAEVIAAWGYPQPSAEIPVAIARLGGGAVDPTQTGHVKSPPPSDAASGGGKVRWRDKPYSQQAYIRCTEEAFQRFILGDAYEPTPESVRDIRTTEAVRHACYVPSRSDIIRGTPAGDRWHDLELEFTNWLKGEAA